MSVAKFVNFKRTGRGARAVVHGREVGGEDVTFSVKVVCDKKCDTSSKICTRR